MVYEIDYDLEIRAIFVLGEVILISRASDATNAIERVFRDANGGMPERRVYR